MSVSSFRETLNKPTASLIADVVRFDKPAAMELQAKLLAIHRAEESLPKEAQQDLFRIRDAAGLEHGLKKAGVNEAGLAAARLEVESQKGMPRAVPLLGMVATSFRLVSEDVKNALMAAQAGERTIRAGELMGGMQSGGTAAPVANVLPGLVTDAREPTEPARGYIGKFKNDPPPLVSAQAVHHLAEMAAGAAALGLNEHDVPALRQVSNDCGVLARRALTDAADALISAGQHGPGEQVHGVMGYAAPVDEQAALSRLAAFTRRQVGNLAMSGLIDQGTAKLWQELVDNRERQALPALRPAPPENPPENRNGPDAPRPDRKL